MMSIVSFLFQVNNGVNHWNGRFGGCFVCSWGEIYKLWMKYGGWEEYDEMNSIWWIQLRWWVVRGLELYMVNLID